MNDFQMKVSQFTVYNYVNGFVKYILFTHNFNVHFSSPLNGYCNCYKGKQSALTEAFLYLIYLKSMSASDL